MSEAINNKNSNIFNLITPKASKLFLRKEGIDHELELVQFLKYSIEENKKPVYGFTNNSFSKTIKGKRIVSGIIGIKKNTRDFITHFLSSSSSITEIENYSLLKCETLKKIINSENSAEAYDFVDNYIKNLVTKSQTNTVKDAVGSEDAFLNIEDATNGLSPVTLDVYNEDAAGTNVNQKANLKFTNVTFVKKEGTITIQENTVLETYTFIANCFQ